MSRRLLAVLVAANLLALQGCATELRRDPRDAPWDPRPGHSLLDQIPNETGGANRVCCGGDRRCEPWQTPRC